LVKVLLFALVVVTGGYTGIEFLINQKLISSLLHLLPRKHQNARLNLFPHPQPLSQRWERGDIILVPLLPFLGEGVRG
jgi:hypothetical protein